MFSLAARLSTAAPATSLSPQQSSGQRVRAYLLICHPRRSIEEYQEQSYNILSLSLSLSLDMPLSLSLSVCLEPSFAKSGLSCGLYIFPCSLDNYNWLEAHRVWLIDWVSAWDQGGDTRGVWPPSQVSHMSYFISIQPLLRNGNYRAPANPALPSPADKYIVFISQQHPPPPPQQHQPGHRTTGGGQSLSII